MEKARLEQYLNEESSQINGWFFPADIISFWLLDVVQKSLGITGDICEVGVFEGKSLVLLSHFLTESEYAHAFDLFPGDMLDKARDNLKQYGESQSRTDFVVGDTANISATELDDRFSRSLRILHIDAGHEYHEVYQQLIMFSPYVSEYGIIIMDDYQDREFPGIEAAVLDFCEIDRPRRFVPFFAGGNKMYLCQATIASILQQQMLKSRILTGQYRYSIVRDFGILIGFSKLPSTDEYCLNAISKYDYPKKFSSAFNEDILKSNASKYGQVNFGMEKR